MAENGRSVDGVMKEKPELTAEYDHMITVLLLKIKIQHI